MQHFMNVRKLCDKIKNHLICSCNPCCIKHVEISNQATVSSSIKFSIPLRDTNHFSIHYGP